MSMSQVSTRVLRRRMLCPSRGIQVYTPKYLRPPTSWSHYLCQPGDVSLHVSYIIKCQRHHILCMTCSFQPLGLGPTITVSFSIGWYRFILLSANVTSSKKPVPITLLQRACPYSRPHHPLIAFVAIIIICNGLVNILVYLFRICVLHLSISTTRARTLPCHCWIYNTWYLAITFCWVNKWTRVLRLVSVTSSEECTLWWHFLRNLICLVHFMLSAFVFNTFTELFWLHLETKMLPRDSKTRNVTFWVEETSQIMPTAFSLLAANKSTIIKMLSKWFEIFLTLSKYHISCVDYPGQRIYHLLECLSSRKLKDIYKYCLINPYIKTCRENRRKKQHCHVQLPNEEAAGCWSLWSLQAQSLRLSKDM